MTHGACVSARNLLQFAEKSAFLVKPDINQLVLDMSANSHFLTF